MPAQTYLFPCLSDNFGVLLHDPQTGATASIDAPEAAPVEAALQKTGWRLTDILVTHHHADHTAGVGELKAKHKCRVVAPRSEKQPIAHVDEKVGEGDAVKVGGLSGRVIDTPGHTAGHISYFFPADKLAFVGDTLFSIGCGRVIEGTPEMMWQSLLKLRGLPDDTQFYCGHEYTDANIRFAKTIEPDNKALAARADEVKRLLAAGKPTIPATIGAEKAENPFLRADLPEVARSVGLAGSPAWKVFAEIRERKTDSNVLTAAEIIRLLDLKPHPEGGHYRQTFRDSLTYPPGQAGERKPGAARAVSSAIYFLLARGERSHWHRVDAVEIWHWHAGAPLELEVAAASEPRERLVLGNDLAGGERPQGIVPAHAWQAARSLGDWTLVGCTVAPGFEFATFELAPPAWEPAA